MLPSVRWAEHRAKKSGWLDVLQRISALASGKFDPARGSIYPYVKSTQLYLCPSDTCRPQNRRLLRYQWLSGEKYQHYRRPVLADSRLCSGRSLCRFQQHGSMWMILAEENTGGSTDDGYMNTDKFMDAAPFARHEYGFLRWPRKICLSCNNGTIVPTNYQYAGGTSCPN